MHIAVANVWLAVVVAVLQLTPAVGAAHGSSWDSHARRSLSGRKIATRRDVDVQARDGIFEPILGE